MLALSFNHIGPGNQIQVVSLGGKHPYPLSHLYVPPKLFLNGEGAEDIAMGRFILQLQSPRFNVQYRKYNSTNDCVKRPYTQTWYGGTNL